MAQADSNNNTRRAFLSNAAGVAARATAAVVATKAVAQPRTGRCSNWRTLKATGRRRF